MYTSLKYTIFAFISACVFDIWVRMINLEIITKVLKGIVMDYLSNFTGVYEEHKLNEKAKMGKRSDPSHSYSLNRWSNDGGRILENGEV